jgi:hypothetical protein
VTPVLAHAGHWALNLVYAVPMIFVVGVIVREKLRQRREERLPDPDSRD